MFHENGVREGGGGVYKGTVLGSYHENGKNASLRVVGERIRSRACKTPQTGTGRGNTPREEAFLEAIQKGAWKGNVCGRGTF